MGTRCNILLKNGATKVWLYRHWDGYPSCTGADLARHIQKADGNAGTLLKNLLTQERDNEPGRVEYELTNDVHGDIEWLYVIEFTRKGAVKVGWMPRKIGLGEEQLPALVRAAQVTREFQAFVDLVNVDVRDANRRLARLKAEQPAHFGECADFQEVTL